MKSDIDAREYFLVRRPEKGPMRPVYSRIANAIYGYSGINTFVTMNQICNMTEKELKKMRNIGAKAQSVIMEECKNYLSNGGQLSESEVKWP